MPSKVQPGKSFPLGAHITPEGVNFSLYARHAEGIDLLLFDHPDDPRPARVITLDPDLHRTYAYWHVCVPGLKPGQIYAYRARGPFDPHSGQRYDSGKVLLDPYSRAVVFPRAYSRALASQPGDNTASALKSALVDPASYDWGSDRPLYRPFCSTVIYEMHVRGFTQHDSSGVAPAKRGTYAGVIDKIPYLKDLGITAVELLPVYAFDPSDAPPGLSNYWGYSPLSFFAPHPFYSSRGGLLGALDEFRDLVKALHKAGIEVILDVVYNHSAEGGQNGPTLSFKGLDNDAYYILGEDKQDYANYSGTGNTLDANHPIVRRMIVDSLCYWVSTMHVDGFRFDLASVFTRDENGVPLANPPVVWDIETEPVLAGAKLIAEAWDAGGLYQVGSFIGDRWKEWNGKFRDDVRAAVRGDSGSLARLPNRLLASPDLYEHEQREPEQSINFITCHDGFTLNDLVSYNSKHNQANHEDNRDGSSDNLSWNCGVEGPSADPDVESLRLRQIKNFLTLTLISMGTPMLMMGDEARRTQGGNNNGYCQDNETSWFDWSLVETNAGLWRFVQKLIQFRLKFAAFSEEDDETLTEAMREAAIVWHGTRHDQRQPDWGSDSHCLALSVTSDDGARQTYILLNLSGEAQAFELPALADQQPWRRLCDSALPSPQDIAERAQAVPLSGDSYSTQAHSVVVLVADLKTHGGEKMTHPGDLFARDYHGGAFVLFGTAHLLGLALVAAVCLGIWLARRRFSPRAQRTTRWGLLALIYLCEGSWQVWMLLTGQWTIQGMLPLWLCSVTSWTMPLLLVARSQRYYEWAYFMGSIGASMALLTPDLLNYGFPHYRFIEFITLHGAVIVAVVYMTAVEGFRPTWRALPRVWLVTNLYWLFCAGVNHLIGSNYLYTQGKLPTPSLLDVLGPYPWYLLSMELLGCLLCLLLYLPFAVKDWRSRQSA